MEQGAASLRFMRMVHAFLMASVALYAIAAEQIAKPAKGLSPNLVVPIAIAACLNGFVAQYLRRKKLFPSFENLRRDPNDPGPLKDWRTGTLVGLVLAESIVLFGFVLRILGARRSVSWPFFALGMVLMLVWRPQMDAAAPSPSVSRQ